MSTILLQHNLHDSKPGDPIRALAQAFTLTALDRLDSEHKNIIILFLYRADLGLSFAMGADFSYTSMIAADMYFLDLENANLQGAHLQFANMEGICLTHARLDGANLQHADLKVFHHLISQPVLYCGQYLTSSGILNNRPTLIPANLSGAVLTNANLTGAYLNGADLTFADLEDANLSHATLSPEQLAQAKLHTGPNILNGLKRP